MMKFEAPPLFDLEALLSQYEIEYPDESEIVQKFLDFYHSSEDVFKRSHQAGHFTASAMLIAPDQSSALMTHHAKLNQWLQLGGHADGETNLYLAALIEAWEESGKIPCKLISQDLLDIDCHEIPANSKESAHYHWDIRFLIQAKHFNFTITQESKSLEWVHWEDKRWLRENSLRRLMEKTKEKLN